jgi:hypothetical protein
MPTSYCVHIFVWFHFYVQFLRVLVTNVANDFENTASLPHFQLKFLNYK